MEGRNFSCFKPSGETRIIYRKEAKLNDSVGLPRDTAAI